MFFPVIVVLDAAADCVDAYERLVPAMAPYTYNDWIGSSYERSWSAAGVDAESAAPLTEVRTWLRTLEAAARCDGWTLGGRDPAALRLKAPAKVAVLGGQFNAELPAAAASNEVRAVVGAPSPVTLAGSEADGGICDREQAPSFARTVGVDLARVGDIERASLSEMYDWSQPCLVVRGQWIELDEYTPQEVLAVGSALLTALPDDAWVAVLSAHL